MQVLISEKVPLWFYNSKVMCFDNYVKIVFEAFNQECIASY